VSEHLGPLVSALADGALDARERAAAESHLAACEACRRELRAAEAVRTALGRLPVVDPPPWFLPAVLAGGPQPHRHRTRRLRFGMANVAATAAAWLVVVAVAGPAPAPAAAPDLAGLLAAHRQAANGSLEAGAPDGGMVAPARLGASFTLAGHRDLDGLTQAVYRSGDRWLSVFAQPGSLDPDALPEAAEPVALGADPAWALDGGRVLLVDRGDSVLVLVAEGSVAPLPPDVEVRGPSDGALDRLVDAGAGLLRAFSLGG
jgi:hypothetical protein